MKKALLTLTCIAVCAGLFAFVYHNYQRNPKPNNTVSLEQFNSVKTQLESAQNTTAKHDRVNEHLLATKQTELERITAQRDKLCTQYKNAKPVLSPDLCK